MWPPACDLLPCPALHAPPAPRPLRPSMPAQALKGSGELPPIQGPGHSYVALPGWVSSLPLTSPTAPPAGQGAAQGGGGGGQGVRFTASVSDRPPSAGPARGGGCGGRSGAERGWAELPKERDVGLWA